MIYQLPLAHCLKSVLRFWRKTLVDSLIPKRCKEDIIKVTMPTWRALQSLWTLLLSRPWLLDLADHLWQQIRDCSLPSGVSYIQPGTSRLPAARRPWLVPQEGTSCRCRKSELRSSFWIHLQPDVRGRLEFEWARGGQLLPQRALPRWLTRGRSLLHSNSPSLRRRWCPLLWAHWGQLERETRLSRTGARRTRLEDWTKHQCEQSVNIMRKCAYVGWTNLRSWIVVEHVWHVSLLWCWRGSREWGYTQHTWKPFSANPSARSCTNDW